MGQPATIFQDTRPSFADAIGTLASQLRTNANDQWVKDQNVQEQQRTQQKTQQDDLLRKAAAINTLLAARPEASDDQRKQAATTAAGGDQRVLQYVNPALLTQTEENKNQAGDIRLTRVAQAHLQAWQEAQGRGDSSVPPPTNTDMIMLKRGFSTTAMSEPFSADTVTGGAAPRGLPTSSSAVTSPQPPLAAGAGTPTTAGTASSPSGVSQTPPPALSGTIRNGTPLPPDASSAPQSTSPIRSALTVQSDGSSASSMIPQSSDASRGPGAVPPGANSIPPAAPLNEAQMEIKRQVTKLDPTGEQQGTLAGQAVTAAETARSNKVKEAREASRTAAENALSYAQAKKASAETTTESNGAEVTNLVNRTVAAARNNIDPHTVLKTIKNRDTYDAVVNELAKPQYEDILSKSPMSSAQRTTLEQLDPLIQQAQLVVKTYEPYKHQNNFLTDRDLKDYALYRAGQMPPPDSPMSQVANMSMLGVQAGARLLKGGSRAYQALTLAMQHAPNGSETRAQIYDKAVKLETQLVNVRNSAIKYGTGGLTSVTPVGENNPPEKTQSGKPLDAATAQQFYKQTLSNPSDPHSGDPRKATQLAIAAGYAVQ